MNLPDRWKKLRTLTSARVALGRAGGSLPTAEVLSFAAAHASARDAVHEKVDWDALETELRSAGYDCVRLQSAAIDRSSYLQRPDLGRRLDDESAKKLSELRRDSAPDLAIIVSDGLSAPAAQRQTVALLTQLTPKLKSSSIRFSPVFIVNHARVAIEDQIGSAIGARAALILLGERPGLGSPDSLGAYLVFDPKPGKTDADRNCVSNIRPGGLSFSDAAETLHYLISQSLQLRMSGVLLKDDRDAKLPPPQ